ncbi:MAG: hypothetical protein AB7E47_16580 [Desulfovibrionaceae bacterium]
MRWLMHAMRRAAKGCGGAMLLALGAACLCVLAAVQGAWAFDGTSRVLVTAADRQMRSVVLRVAGESALPAAVPTWRRYEVALADARLRAFRAVRTALGEEIAGRGADLAFAFLGQDGNATMAAMPLAMERAVADATVFVRRAEAETVAAAAPDRSSAERAGDVRFRPVAYRVRADVEVVYLLLPAPRGVAFARNAEKPLDMAPTDVRPDSPRAPFDFEAAYRALEKALVEKMRLEAEGNRLSPEGKGGVAGAAGTGKAGGGPGIAAPSAPRTPKAPAVAAP